MVRVLLLEDSPSDRLLLEDELRHSFDIDLTTADTLEDGLAHLGSTAFDLALVDLNLPDSTGVATLERVRTAAGDIPVIVVSGQSDDATTRRILAAGADDCLPKGGLFPELIARSIRFTLERHRIALELKCRLRDLADGSRRLRTIVDLHSNAVVVVDGGGTVQFVNPQAEAMFGRAAANFVGQPFGLPLDTGRAVEIDIRQDSGVGVAEMRVVPADWDGQPAHIAFLQDVTEQRRATRNAEALNAELEARVAARTRELEEARYRAEASDRLKSAFLATMSHELRTPLNAIIGFSELLVRERSGPLTPRQRAYVDDVLLSGRHLLQLINSVLDLSKIESGTMRLHTTRFDVRTVAREVCSVLAPLAQSKSVDLALDVRGDAATVWLDQGKLRQILFNLLSNGVKFTPGGGRVTLVLDLSGDEHVLFRVVDTGVGVAPEDQGRLFVEFQQLDAGLGRQYEGTGLGLALTKKLVELHGGAVSVESALGKGSTFAVSLPRDAALVSTCPSLMPS